MADQALFAYHVELPDGSTIVRTGGADVAPTHAQLADYAANQGERYLGPVAMSPMPTAKPPAEEMAAPPPAPSPMPAPAAAVASPGTFLQQAGHLLSPPRPLTSQGLEILGGTLGSAASTLTGPAAPAVAPALSAFGSGMGEAGQVGLEHVMGWPPAEEGTLQERMGRAMARGATGEMVVGWPLRAGAALVSRTVGPVARAAEEVAPILTREVPAGTTVARMTGTGLADVGVEHLPIETVLRQPELLAHAAPEVQQMALGRWWQAAAGHGREALVNSWDEFGEAAQRALAGDQFEAVTTLINTLRPGTPISQMTPGRLAAAASVSGGLPGLLWHAGIIPKEVAMAIPVATQAARAAAPELLLHPTSLNWLARLPQIGRVASPYADVGTRAAGQWVGQKLLP